MLNTITGSALGCLLVAMLATDAGSPPTRIKPEEARRHVGKCVEVTFRVQASKHSVRRKTVYLDSEKNFQDEKNLGIAISEEGQASLRQERGIAEAHEYYRDKEIRVVGEIVLEDDRPYIKVDKADAIDLAKPPN